jgi:hypothetical protein
VVLGLAVALAAAGLGCAVGWVNYHECRAAAFSRFYCATTQLVR